MFRSRSSSKFYAPRPDGLLPALRAWLRSWLEDDMPPRTLSPLVVPALSVEAALWLAPRLLPWPGPSGVRVGAVVPVGFAAYARVFHPAETAYPDRRPLRWHEVASWAGRTAHAEMQWDAIASPAGAAAEPPWAGEPVFGHCPDDVLRPLVERLSAHTAPDARVHYALWIGFADVQAIARPDIPRFELPAREYLLVEGPLAAATALIASSLPSRVSASLWWPEDRAWCVATEVDYRWTYVAGSEACIADILDDPRLEALRTAPQHRGDLDGDHVNTSRTAGHDDRVTPNHRTPEA